MLPVVGRFFPKFELVDIDGGHWVISEKPEEFRRGEFVALVDMILLKLLIKRSGCGVATRQGLMPLQQWC